MKSVIFKINTLQEGSGSNKHIMEKKFFSKDLLLKYKHTNVYKVYSNAKKYNKSSLHDFIIFLLCNAPWLASLEELQSEKYITPFYFQKENISKYQFYLIP